MSDNIAHLRPGRAADPPAKPVLHALARLDVEQARKFLIDLDTAAARSTPLLAMFLLGRCAEHAQSPLDVVDAVTELNDVL